MPTMIAHGALGPWDEIVFIAVTLIFLGMMVLNWLRSRGLPLEDAPTAAGDLNAEVSARAERPNERLDERFELK